MKRGAVAVDLGATSGRYAAGWIDRERIVTELVEQVPNRQVESAGNVHWDVDGLYDLCDRAWKCAGERFDEATVGIDSWGVDHGFIDDELQLVQPPIAYRDLAHQAMFEAMAVHRDALYALTGIQHQPFNTIYQLACRARERPELKGLRWLCMPDLMGLKLTGVLHCEFTMASTTQLMGLDDTWSAEAFNLIGWPVLDMPISMPGRILATRANVRLASVGSHDTASAVFGLGPLGPDQAFLNVGTWSLVGTMLDAPNLSDPAFTNERAVDGRVRYLTNIPGFYVINRVYEELGLEGGVGGWLGTGEGLPLGSVDLTSPAFFNPSSMSKALAAAAEQPRPDSPGGWAALALGSLVETTARQLDQLAKATHRTFREIRVSGGGSRSEVFCRQIANRTGLKVVAGPEEATLLGNLGMQFVASGEVESLAAAEGLIGNSSTTRAYEPSNPLTL